jgi:hypothetical protein
MPPQPPPDSQFFRALEAIASSPDWRRSGLRDFLRHAAIFALGLLVISFALSLLANARSLGDTRPAGRHRDNVPEAVLVPPAPSPGGGRALRAPDHARGLGDVVGDAPGKLERHNRHRNRGWPWAAGMPAVFGSALPRGLAGRVQSERDDPEDLPPA